MPTAAKTSMKGFPDPTLTLDLPPAASLDLKGRRVVVVGGTDGLGRALARLAAERGAEVTVIGRTFRDEGVKGLSFVKADLSSMREALRIGRELPVEAADVVVLTTGIMAAKQREVTSEGVERDLAVSYLSRFAVLEGMTERLGRSLDTSAPKPRVFVMGFPGSGQLGDPSDLNAERGYDGFEVHMNTVAGNEALVLDGARRAPGVGFFGLNPGLIKTKIRANYLGDGSLTHRVLEFFIGLTMQSPERYAERVVPLLFARELEGRSGVMFGAKATPILPTEGFDAARAEQFAIASRALLERAVGAHA